MKDKGPRMKYVYLIRSLTAPDQCYVGVTSNVDERLRAHNAGQSPHTS
jgi:predicted GIY-YIG superfamily endonuclease